MNISNVSSLTKEEIELVKELRQIRNDHKRQRLIWLMEGWIEEINIRRYWEDNHERC